MSRTAEVAVEEYKGKQIEVDPCFPNILVRVLDKEQTRGGIVLPNIKQNKPVAEAVVIKVYKPFWATFYKAASAHEQASIISWKDSKHTILDDENKVYRIWKESEAQPGDHVLIPHIGFGITPVWPLDDGKGEFKFVQEGLILSRVTYEEEHIEDWLRHLCASTGSKAIEDFVDVILKNADVIRHRECVTISGS